MKPESILHYASNCKEKRYRHKPDVRYFDLLPLLPNPCKRANSQILKMVTALLRQDSVKCWNKGLCQPEGEDKFRPSHQKLWRQSLEESCWSLVLYHVGDNPDTTLGILEVPVLNSGLDNVQWCRNNQGGRSTSDGGNEILVP